MFRKLELGEKHMRWGLGVRGQRSGVRLGSGITICHSALSGGHPSSLCFLAVPLRHRDQNMGHSPAAASSSSGPGAPQEEKSDTVRMR